MKNRQNIHHKEATPRDLATFVMALEANTVETGNNGAPVAWRLFKLGKNELTKEGVTYNLDITDEMIDAIIVYFRQKGTKIPLDSRHFLYHLSEKYNRPEEEVSAMMGGYATFGFGELQKRDDGLWIINVEYLELAEKIMAEHTWRYFSPVIRGFADGAWRVTSVTFTNEPALNNLDAIAAESENYANLATLNSKINQFNKQQKENAMNKVMTAVAALIGMNAIALDADGEADESVITKINQLKTSIDANSELRKNLVDTLALDAEADNNAVTAALKGLQSKAETADELTEKVDALVLESENRKLNDLIAKGKSSGQLTNDMVKNWIVKEKVDAVALEAFLKHSPVVIPLSQINRENLKDNDSIALSDDDIADAEKMGVTKEELIEHRKSQK